MVAGRPVRPPSMHTHPTEPETLPIDPVCGVEVDPATDLRTDYKGQTYYFCSPGCKKSFDKEPEKYTGQSAPGGHDERP